VDSVKRQHDHHREVRDQEQRVEGIPAIKMLKGLVAIMGAEVVLQAVLVTDQEGERAGAVRKRGQQRCGDLGQVAKPPT
jgi:hypothetical protein